MPISRIEWRRSTSFTIPQSAQRRRRNDPTLLLAVTAVFAACVAVGAGIAFERNAARFDRYHDASCVSGAIGGPRASTAATGVCSADSAQVVAHWIHRYRRSSDYFYALKLRNGDVDTVLLESHRGNTPRSVWESTPLGTSFVVQRFRASAGDAKPHVTLVRFPAEVMQTDWNPVYRSADAIIGFVVFSLIALGCGFTAWHKRRTLL